MPDDKIIIRSKIIEIIYNLKNSESFSEKNLFKATCMLKKLKNDDFVISTLLKEIDFQNPNFDIALIYISKMLSPELTKSECQKIIKKNTVADKKKLFLMNVLRELGESISYEETKEYLNEPENIQDTENELMARLATLNPEAQIDFLDFFFTISDENKILLLDSLKEENTGSELTQALEPIVYYDTNAKYIKNIIEILKETKCYSSKLLLDFISKSNSKYANLAKSAKNELTLSGLRENPTKREILKTYLQNTLPLGFWGSLIDGADNFSIIFARQKGDKTIATFFNVLNLKTGISSTFGFDNITIQDFKKILKRFFKATFMIKLDDKIGAKILSDFEKITIKNNRKIPYEYLAWKNYTVDIDVQELDLIKTFEKELEKVKVTDEIYENLYSDNILMNWFVTTENSQKFEELTAEISKSKLKIQEIEKKIKENVEEIFPDCELIKKLIFESYFLSQIEFIEKADTLYSISKSKKYLKRMKIDMLKFSLYQHFLKLRDEKNNIKNIFSKEESDADFQYYIDLFEEKWSK